MKTDPVVEAIMRDIALVASAIQHHDAHTPKDVYDALGVMFERVFKAKHPKDTPPPFEEVEIMDYGAIIELWDHEECIVSQADMLAFCKAIKCTLRHVREAYACFHYAPVTKEQKPLARPQAPPIVVTESTTLRIHLKKPKRILG